MKEILIFFSLSISLTSCGKLRNQRLLGKGIPSGNTAAFEEPASNPLSSTELPIALRICNSLSAKRQFLTTSISVTAPKRIAYNFSLERKDCKKNVIEKQIIMAEILSSNPTLYYNAPESSNEFNDVITDKTDALLEICPAVILAAPNIKIGNSAAPFGSDKIFFVKFTDEKGFDTVQINTKVANGKGGYNPYDVQLISFYTKDSQVDDKNNLGVEKERSQYVACNGREFPSKRETFNRLVILP